ncbi:MAG: aminoacyl-tRNA hydrolase [Planctomycetia bacterium]|nr:aminoacyl-tRNA hydrolase [Planctomycetia bacterium]
MKLIVGLGNPGAKYVGTRHNMGYEVLAELGRRYGTGRPKMKFQGEVLEAEIHGERVILLSPTTYMNLSGQSVRPCVDFYKIAVSDVLVICDDVSLPTGKLRIRAKGSSGGQKGLADVIRVMGGADVARLRIGIGEKPAGWDLADYVLSKFSKAEAELISAAVQRAADAAAMWVVQGLSRCMDAYNGQE